LRRSVISAAIHDPSFIPAFLYHLAMSLDHVSLSPTALIVGCGYIGQFLAPRLIARGSTVFGIVRSPASAKSLAALGVQPLIADITQPVSLLAAIRPVLASASLDVYHLVPPGRPSTSDRDITPDQVVLEGAKNVLSALSSANVRRIVVASSTAVYGQTSGEHVDADTPARATDERSQLLIDGEELWLSRAASAHIVRLAGLYGPGRIIGLQAVRSGAPLAGDPSAWLNLIHADDAADLLIAMMTAAQPSRIELGSDGSPVPRIEYYSTLAKTIGVQPPRVLEMTGASSDKADSAQRLRRASSKQCDNVITCQRTGWLPRFPHFRDGLIASFEAMRK